MQVSGTWIQISARGDFDFIDVTCDRYCTYALENFAVPMINCEISLMDACKTDHTIMKTFSGWKKESEFLCVEAKWIKLDENCR